jgi:phosphatidylethanolamine/phosphatidyl-N-methylethanolamine N-methyltransferase
VGATRNELAQRLYDRIAGVYDLIFGAILQPGREQAVRSMPSRPGLRVLEMGIGTGLTIPLYPRDWRIAGVDLSASMLAKARARAASSGVHLSIALLRADGARLPFADDTFDVVLVPYTISVVPDPYRVAQEARRVCRSTGRVILLNHFLSERPAAAGLERLISPLTRRLAFRTDLALAPLLAAAGLKAIAIERVNFPALWKLVTSVKDQ